MDPIKKINSYLSGEVSLKTFYDDLMVDHSLQDYLEQDVSIPPYTKNGNLFLYIADQDSSNAASDLNVKDALSQFLTAKGVEHSVDKTASRNYGLVLDASPSWVSLSDEYISSLIESLPNNISRTAQVKMVNEKILSDYRYLKKAPKWLQSPEWPLSHGKPLLFIGQMDLGNIMHDDAQVYLFFDENENSFETLTQVA
ncbi:hypothetical protein ACBY01_11835 [Sphingomonas sp. ac-8]|uniref:hypothetical protein n=1 Tax=Sphingomonas sp. ac-8 TaxID=3242977 RepID=UPI003A812F5F